MREPRTIRVMVRIDDRKYGVQVVVPEGPLAKWSTAEHLGRLVTATVKEHLGEDEEYEEDDE